MIQRSLLCCLMAAILLSPGCLFSKKSRKKSDGSIASEVEESLKQRWVDRRASELVATGTAAETARNQALQEFREKFEYTSAAKK